MGIARAFSVSLLLLCAFAGQVLAAGLHVERLQDLETNICPVCHRVIVPGGIHEDAEQVLTTEFGAALAGKGIRFTQEDGETRSLSVLVYRFQERQGGNFAVRRPASVGFHVHLFEDGALSRVFVFDETQQPLLDNVLRVFTFFKRKARWITAGELAREGVTKAVDLFADDLKDEAGGAGK